jgi:hypothetical protein
LRAGAGQHQPADQLRAQQGHFLRDHPADREPQQVDPGQVERVGERDDVAGHLGNGARNGPRRQAHPGVIHNDDLAVPRESAEQQRIPVIQVAAKVLQHHQRQHPSRGSAEPPVRVRHPITRVN